MGPVQVLGLEQVLVREQELEQELVREQEQELVPVGHMRQPDCLPV